MHTSEAPDFRRWAAQVARQADDEPDATSTTLMSIPEYREKLADIEDWQRESPVGETTY
jgi:hypothetical protein